MIFLGICGIIDPPREEVAGAIHSCKNAGVNVKMITGDHALTAKVIAKQVGIDVKNGVLTGADIDKMDDVELEKRIGNINVYARTSPLHKLRLVKALQNNKEIVAMTGDGVNDAPALKQSEIGVAMGVNGTEAAKEVAEMVLADDNFVSIKNAIEAGRVVYDNIKKAIIYTLPTNAAEGFAVMMAILFGTLLPITAVQILWVNTVTAVTLALALGFEKAESNVMKRRPRKTNENILSKFLVWRIIFVSILLVSAVFGLFIFERANGVSIKVARTIVVNMLVVGEIFYLLNCRKIYESGFSFKNIFGSIPVLISIFIVMCLQLIYTYLPGMESFFGSNPIGLYHWLQIIVCGILIFVFVEIEKLIMRRIVKR